MHELFSHKVKATQAPTFAHDYVNVNRVNLALIECHSEYVLVTHHRVNSLVLTTPTEERAKDFNMCHVGSTCTQMHCILAQ